MRSPGAPLRQAWFWIREFFGENAYGRYVADWQARHHHAPPDAAHRLLTEREFFERRLAGRYASSVARC